MAQDRNIIECRLADGANVLVKGKVTVERDTKNSTFIWTEEWNNRQHQQSLRKCNADERQAALRLTCLGLVPNH